MKTKFKFIHFVKVEDKPKTSVWSCRNNRSGDELGIVKWYPGWRQYCFFPAIYEETVYSAGCFEDIKTFMGQL